MTIKRADLLKDLQRQVKALERDLGEQVNALGEVHNRLRAEYDEAFQVERTAADWQPWLGERIIQVAAAWVLGTVFVRFCEDNGLLPDPFLAGPDPARMALAEELQDEFFHVDPGETDRGWLIHGFDAIGAVPAGATTPCSRSPSPTTRPRRSSPSGAAAAPTARSSTTSPTPILTPGFSATCTRTCPRTRVNVTRCCRPPTSSRSSSSI